MNSSSGKFWQNEEPLTTAGLDRGMQFGDGHFTTIRVSNGKPLWWSFHWQRLQEASQRLALPLPSEERVLTCLTNALADSSFAAEPCLVAKIIITSGAGQRGYQRPAKPGVNWYLSIQPTTAVNSPSPVQTDFAPFELAWQPVLGGLKTLNRLEQVLLMEALKDCAPVTDFIVSDARLMLCEATRGNLFWFADGQWCTPAIHGAGVAGVARAVILANHWLGEVRIADFPQAAILGAEQAFICNTLSGATPIATVGSHRFDSTRLPPELRNLIE